MSDYRPQHFINRELSLLEFNYRVLAQSERTTIPLLERLLFLTIFSSNLDEFFEIRVGGLKERLEAGIHQPQRDGLDPSETLALINHRAHNLVNRQYEILNTLLLPALAAQRVQLLRREHLNEAQRTWLKNRFEVEIKPLLSPLGLDPAHPFPRILNKSLNFIVELEGKDAFGRNSGLAIVQVPRALPDMFQLPKRLAGHRRQAFVLTSSMIHSFIGDLFHGMSARAAYQFRVTRNSDFFVDEEEVDDLRRAIEGELVQRQYGDEVRLEVATNCPAHITEFLLRQFEMTEQDLYQVDGPVNLGRLRALHQLCVQPELHYPPFSARQPKPLRKPDSAFSVLRKRDVLLHHPFDSFHAVIDFIWAAARDNKVMAIKQTLYRTGPDSVIVDALVAAAKAGKEVTVVIELRARFDEEANLALAAKLQQVGIHVVYGVVGYKTHAKMILITRRDKGHIRHYVHLGTGNYHPMTSRIYTDYGLLSANQELGQDVSHLFFQLTSLGKTPKMAQMIHAPFSLHKTLLKYIDAEIAAAKAGKPARIIAKMNGLYEDQLTEKLYDASQAGVEIDLIVRGICQLRPGTPKLSDNIRVRSILGRFLEHTRVFYFHNRPEKTRLWASSADWMERNMHYRVETAFPILNAQHRKRIMLELEDYLNDNTEAWILQSDGQYLPRTPAQDEPILSVQTKLLEQADSKLN
jgi:polyphosphate kinase